MPIYNYYCPPCDVAWDVDKSREDWNSPEQCPSCARDAVKGVNRFQVDKLCLTTGSGISTESFNPGLGCMTKSTKDAERIARGMGLEPAGNETAESIQKYTKGRVEKAREERWEKADREMVFE